MIFLVIVWGFNPDCNPDYKLDYKPDCLGIKKCSEQELSLTYLHAGADTPIFSVKK